MNSIKSRLSFTGAADASVFFYTRNEATAAFSSTVPVSFGFTDQYGAIIAEGVCDRAEQPFSGTVRLTFRKGEKAQISLGFTGDTSVYLMPGAGVLWEHGGVFPLLLSKETEHTLFIVAADGDTSPAVAVVKGVDFGEDVSITAGGKSFPADWYPKLGRPWFWHSAELPTERVLRADVKKCASDLRFTVYGRTVVSLNEAFDIPFGKVFPTVTSDSGELIDARIEVFAGDERVALFDRLTEETSPIYLPCGRYRFRVSHGMMYSVCEALADVTADGISQKFTLTEKIRLPKGWVTGELHTHSALEDATLFPRQVMRAARACGRSFCFMTDKNVELDESFGLHECDKDGVFAAFPGQEIMCHELHTNVLNPSYTTANPEAEDLKKVNTDIEEKIAGWLCEYRSMRSERPCLIMHNHPTHRAEVAKRGHPYFRSWWVSDLFSDDYHLVENCGFEGWFDRLNRGKRLYAAWTGDGHDCTLVYPGMEGVCVYTGGELTAKAVIEALEAGRFFSCREPGAFIDVQKAADGRVRVTVKASVPIDRLELVSDGRVSHTAEGGGELEMCREFDTEPDTGWCIARVKLAEGDWDPKLYSFTPFMESGYAAFTNPISMEKQQ